MTEQDKDEQEPVLPHPDSMFPELAEPLLESLTIRDYFAGQAMLGIMNLKIKPDTFIAEVVGVECYKIADAMLKERDKND